MKRVLVTAILCLATLGFAQAAQAGACFDWNCDSTTYTCTFNASCSTANPFVWKWAFSWGDGTGTGLSGSSSHSHQYDPNDAYPDVTLRVYSWDEPNVQEVTCELVVWNPVGPPQPTYGRCPTP